MSVTLINYRLIIFIIPFLLLLIKKSSQENSYKEIIAIILSAGCLFSNCLILDDYRKVTNDLSDILGDLPPQKRILNLVYDSIYYPVALDLYVHLPAWYESENSGIVDWNFSEFYTMLVR